MTDSTAREPIRQADSLFETCYQELHSIATAHMRRERRNHTLQATAIVHEAYLKLTKSGVVKQMDRNHFLAVASRAMNQVLIDYGRARKTAKRGEEPARVPLEGLSGDLGLSIVDDLALTEALEHLGCFPDKGQRMVALVQMVYLGGLEIQEAAEQLGLRRRQATRDWRFALTWLRRELSAEPT